MRPSTIDDDALLEAAREVFRERGARATTLEIARRAGVSEGSLFKRYATKDELLIAALAPPPVNEVLESIGAMLASGPPLEGMARATQRLIAFYREVLPRFMLMMSCHLTVRDFFCDQQDPPPVRMLRGLTGHLQGQMDAGRLAPSDAEVLARMWVGSVTSWVMAELQCIQEKMPMEEERMVHGIARQLTLRPEGAAP